VHREPQPSHRLQSWMCFFHAGEKTFDYSGKRGCSYYLVVSQETSDVFHRLTFPIYLAYFQLDSFAFFPLKVQGLSNDVSSVCVLVTSIFTSNCRMMCLSFTPSRRLFLTLLKILLTQFRFLFVAFLRMRKLKICFTCKS
jgi:hypothetical protein